ncbi:MAG: histidine phosphatase family protein [Clostridia bacterium]|nr:histidine phosphatase family protein [Clostridia bacterium]
MLLFYVRHGDPIYQPDSLTELGHKQAEALVARMRECRPQKIFSSTSTRAIMTAEPTAHALGLEIEKLDWCHEDHAFRELAHTDENGRQNWLFRQPKMRQMLASPEVHRLDKSWYTHPALTQFEAGIARIQRETDALMHSLGYRHDTARNGYVPESPAFDRVALFAHEGFGAAFLSCLLDIPYPQFCTHFEMGHSGMTVIEFRDGEELIIPRVLQTANDSHIFAAGISTDYQNRIHF